VEWLQGTGWLLHFGAGTALGDSVMRSQLPADNAWPSLAVSFVYRIRCLKDIGYKVTVAVEVVVVLQELTAP